MATDLPYFQFEPSQYVSGAIQFCSLPAQGLFINVLSIYWQRGCDLTITQVKKRWNEPELIQELIDENVIKVDEDRIYVQFLIDQYNKVVDISKKRSENGKIGNSKRWSIDRKIIAKPSQSISQNIASRVEYSRVDKSNSNGVHEKAAKVKKVFVPPSVDDVIAYFNLKGYSNEGAKAAYEYYETANWYDSRGKPVLNWKQKCIANWFKPQYKTVEPQKRGVNY